MAYIGQTLTEGTRRVYPYTASASQQVFPAVFTVGQVDVTQNGILLMPADYNSSSGTQISLNTPAALNDEIQIICHNTFSVADTVSSSQGGTFLGAVTASNGLTVDDSAATPLTIDRATDNGDIIDLQKDGTSVGNIAVDSNDNIMFGAKTGGGAGFYLHGSGGTDPFVLPMKENALSDNENTLGDSARRFKDLYLGGGIYLGGTGAANKLEDVEEGTWSPNFNEGSVTLSSNSAFYIKIGKLVTAGCRVANPTNVTSNNIVTLTGLPFTINASFYNNNIGSVWGNKLGLANSFYIYSGSSATSCSFYYGASGSTGYSPVRYNNLYSDTNMIMRFHYMST